MDNGGSDIRMKEIDRIRTYLEKHIETRKRLYRTYKRLYNAMNGISIGTSSIAGIISGTTVAFMTNPVIILPLGITNTVLAATGIISGVCSKKMYSKMQKHENLRMLGSSTLSKINSLLSESLKDNHISDDEFKKILKTYQDYLNTYQNIKKSFHKSVLIEKQEIQVELSKLKSK